MPSSLRYVSKRIVVRMKDCPRDFLELRENVTWRCRIFSAHTTSAKLSRWGQQVHVVRSTKGLSHVHDGTIERCFAMMVSRVLSNVSGKLCDL